MQTNNANNEMKKVYKLGKSIKGIGSWMLWGTILIPIFMIAVFIIGTLTYSYTIAEILVILLIGFGIAIGVFQILTVIYIIIMIVRGFTTASATGIKKYMVFSLLYLLSYLITIIMYGVLFYLIFHQANHMANNLLSTFNNLTAILSDPISFVRNIFNSIHNVFNYMSFIVFVPIIGAFMGYIMRIIAWGLLKGGIKRTANIGTGQRASSSCALMIVSLIFLGIFNIAIFISSILPILGFVVILILALPYFIFYILEVSAFISIGKRLKTAYSKKGDYQAQMNEPTLSGHPNQYSSYGNSPYGNSPYGNPNRQPQYSSQQGYNNNPNPYGSPNYPSQYSSQPKNSFGAKSTDGPLFCPECGSPNSKTDRICKFCGRPLHK